MNTTDELGAHVSAAGGTSLAPARARDLDAAVLQLFTKQPNRWAERSVAEEEAHAFRHACRAHAIRVTAAHDSYLINLASPDDTLLARSQASFEAELQRCHALGLHFLVTHPGNATDGDRRAGIRRNATALCHALDAVPGSTRVLLEGTAGSGHSLGASFEELAAILDPVAQRHPHRIGLCLDTCHLWAAGHNLHRLDDLLLQLDRTPGIHHLHLLHLNDSATPFHSRRDRHAHIGAGTIGLDTFRNLLHHPALARIPKVIETPKDDDPLAADRANLARLRSLRSAPKKGVESGKV
jgi:deoxyribonuclease IV